MGGAKTALLPLKQIMKKRNKILLGITALGLTTLFAMPMLYNNTTEQTKAVKKERVKTDLKKYATYNDDTYTITLTVNELNNYTWNNLNTLLINQYEETHFFYIDTTSMDEINGHTYEYDEYSVDGDYAKLMYTVNYGDEDEWYGYLRFNKNDNNKFAFDLDDELTPDYEYTTFQADFVWHLNNNNYSLIKTAIQADIDANAQSESMGEGIVHAIASGLGLIGELASEFLTGFSTLFWANDALTPFGLFALIFLGISVSFAIVKLILNIVRSNTGA